MKLSAYLICTVCLLLVALNHAEKRTPEEWKSRIVYHILTDRFSKSAEGAADPECDDLTTWCGGTWKGIVDQLDYIQGLGANAIWISPIVLNTPGGYHGYWAKNIYEQEPNFGTEAELQELVFECHQRDIWVMVDVVPNHMGYPHGCTWPEPVGEECDDVQLQNFTGLTPFNEARFYHDICHIVDYENQTQVEYCRLANLPDLNQTVPEVRQALYSWIHNLTDLYQFDGYRVDTIKHIAIDFWGGYQDAADNFLLGECWNEDEEYVAKYQEHVNSLFNFPSFLTTNGIFHNGEPMSSLADTLAIQREAFLDVSVLGLLADNHDFPRFLHESPDTMLLKNVLIYVLMGEGIPFIYYGTEQSFNGGSDPAGRESLWPHYDTSSEMYQYISTLTRFRLDNMGVMTTPQAELYADDTVLAFSRGDDEVIAVMNKLGSGASTMISIPGLAAWEGNEYTNILNQSDIITVSDCSLLINIYNGEPKVYQKSVNGTAIDPSLCPLSGTNSLGYHMTAARILMMMLTSLFFGIIR